MDMPQTQLRDVTLQSDITKQQTIQADGSYKRPDSTFRNVIEKDGQFPPEAGRYHLYVVYGCPWATRTLITRKIKGLEDIIGITIASSRMDEHGWPFANIDPLPGAEVDPFYGLNHIKDLYLRADPEYSGRFTVPILWDKKTETIVNNESSEIIRIFNGGFNDFLPAEKAAIDLYPAHLRGKIDETNAWVYDTVNNGVYRAGFAKSQEAYEAAVIPLFESLDKLEKMLTGKEYLVGDQLTEADVRLIRHDYPAIHLWLRKLYWKHSAFQSSTNFTHIAGYFSIGSINPTRIVPLGPLPPIEPL
ncbi:glutathione S-transferase [Heliocybe sulcata]|uniref:Glutathione S-transferase n=1 Tax=Heliocybe sulcata TaxID=5364 RepID=A0A5C3MXY3_9AGAM|nr:glutathione S-transferase [Heliocybe sulcata]